MKAVIDRAIENMVDLFKFIFGICFAMFVVCFMIIVLTGGGALFLFLHDFVLLVFVFSIFNVGVSFVEAIHYVYYKGDGDGK